MAGELDSQVNQKQHIGNQSGGPEKLFGTVQCLPPRHKVEQHFLLEF
jgi:hypothetical protein